MTLIAVLTNSVSSILIADSRLTFSTPHQPDVYRDVCQKVIALGDKALVGFSGNAKVAYKVLSVMSGACEKRGIYWLKSESEWHGLMDYCGVTSSNDPRVQFMVTFIDGQHEVIKGRNGAITIKFDSLTRKLEYTYLGLLMAGSGEALQTEMVSDSGINKIFNFGEPGPLKLKQSAIFLSEKLNRLAIERGIDGVGGLFQIYVVTDSVMTPVPYERWIDIGKHHGTFVQMRVDDIGAWIQIHEPTGLRVPLGIPVQNDDVLTQGSTDLRFELAETLNPDSPGVIPRENPQLVYRILE